MSESVLATDSFWRDLLERAGRQAAQTALPLVAAIGAAGTIDVKPVVVAIAGAVILTVVKALVTVNLNMSADEAWYWVLLDRAVPAAAGTALGMWPVDAFDITKVDWGATAWAAAAAAVLALLSYYVTPPTAAVKAQLKSSEPLGSSEPVGSNVDVESSEPLGPTEVL